MRSFAAHAAHSAPTMHTCSALNHKGSRSLHRIELATGQNARSWGRSYCWPSSRRPMRASSDLRASNWESTVVGSGKHAFAQSRRGAWRQARPHRAVQSSQMWIARSRKRSARRTESMDSRRSRRSGGTRASSMQDPWIQRRSRRTPRAQARHTRGVFFL